MKYSNLHFIHTVNGDGSKTAKNHYEAAITQHHVDIQAM